MRFSLQCIIVSVYVLMFSLAGCTQQQQQQSVQVPPLIIDPKSTIGSVSQIFGAGSIRVRGIGLVAGLAGTGSSECPPSVREELEKYIWKKIPQTTNPVNPGMLIESQNTAVVEIFGVIPSLSTIRSGFDVLIRPLSSTQTTSLDGGYLYTTELKELSRLTNIEQFTQYTKVIAEAEGPVYSNKLQSAESSNWYVLGGGHALEEGSVQLILRQGNFVLANAVRNRINERFGPKTAIPDSYEKITLNFPPLYYERKAQFLSMVQSLILAENPAIRMEYLQSLIEQFVAEPKESIELALESFGKPGLDALAPLLEHPDPSIRFYIARCMLNIGDERPVQTLRNIIIDRSSPYRIPAIDVLGRGAKRSTSRPILLNTLSDTDIEVRLAAYEMLLRLESPEISRKHIAKDSFVVDSILCGGPKVIYVYQQKSPRIVIFGSPMQCEGSLFIQSDDSSVSINAAANDDFILVSRKQPSGPRVIGPLSSSRQVSNILQTLGELPESKNGSRLGLAIPYAEILPILRKMCQKNAIQAEFIASPESTTGKEFQDFQ